MSILVTEGRVEAPPRQVPESVDFAVPPPGLRDLRRFRLTALDDMGCLFSMRAVDEPDVRLFLVPPRAYFPDYAPRLDATTRSDLALAGDDAVLLVVVHPGRDGGPPTANLLAPLFVNPDTGRALQVVLDDDWPLRAPLTATGAVA